MPACLLLPITTQECSTCPKGPVNNTLPPFSQIGGQFQLNQYCLPTTDALIDTWGPILRRYAHIMSSCTVRCRTASQIATQHARPSCPNSPALFKPAS